MRAIEVFVETGPRRVFVGALDWPGWCRSARNEADALAALVAYAPRYRAALGSAARGFPSATTVRELRVVERLKGNATTDFGAPDIPPARDSAPLEEAELERLARILRACWTAFDRAAEATASKTLRTGPRGGGRGVPKMIDHVFEADRAYLAQIGGKDPGSDGEAIRRAFVEALRARARGAIPDRGPRGGKRWSARYALRRSAWHALDHAWEIEDRSATASPGVARGRALVELPPDAYGASPLRSARPKGR